MKPKNRLFHPQNWEPGKLRPLVDELNAFSWRLIAGWNHRVLTNGAFSPFGLILLLAKMGLGENKGNLKELDQQVFSEDFIKTGILSENLDSLLAAYLENDSLLKLFFSTQFWYHQGMKIHSDFLHSPNGHEVKISEINFGTEDAAENVNHWFTHSNNQKLSPQLDFLNGNWVISQLAAWNGAWQIPFDPHQTVRGTFRLGDPSKKEVAVKFMRTYGHFAYQEDDAHQYVRIPLGEGLFSLVLIQTPDIHEKIKGFQIDRPKNEMIRLEIPQWQISHVSDYKRLLVDTGLGLAFDIDRADFSHISNDPIWLDQVIQSVNIDINEKGIGESAKASLYAGPRGEATRNVKTLRFNKPFIFLLQENMTGLILFMGKKCS